MRLLIAAISLRDKLLLGLMYATGVRVSEVARLRWRDIDFDRLTVNVWQGKGRVDRQVMLPVSFQPLLKELSKTFEPDDYIFPGQRSGRHVSPRTVERIMQRAVKIAGIGKRDTPHSLRHSFATHLFEGGTDIRYIQKFLGHVQLETTRIYTKVAVIRQHQIESPLDTLTGRGRREQGIKAPPRPVGRLRIDIQPKSVARGESPAADVTVTILTDPRPVELTGIVIREARPGWLVLDVPPLESWAESMRWLTPPQKERIMSPDFYELLRGQATQQFLRQKPPNR